MVRSCRARSTSAPNGGRLRSTGEQILQFGCLVVLILSTGDDNGRFEKDASVFVFGDDEALVAATGQDDPAAMIGFDEVTHDPQVIPLSHNGNNTPGSSLQGRQLGFGAL